MIPYTPDQFWSDLASAGALAVLMIATLHLPLFA